MQVQDASDFLPLFMRAHDKSLRSDVRPVSARDYVYDDSAQRSVWTSSAPGPSGYHTNSGNDFTKTDEV